MKKYAAIILCAALLLPLLAAQAGESAVKASGDYEYTLNQDGTALITKYLGSAAQADVPALLDGVIVTVIGKEAFYNHTELVGATIPQGVRAIEEKAFGSCKQLTNITLPDSLETLGDRAFRSCLNLKTISIPAGLADIGEGAFDYCQSLAEFVVSTDNPSYRSVDGVLFEAQINTLVCYPCGKPGSDYAIPEGTLNIGPNAFNYALNLIRVTLPQSMTEIGEYAFYGAESLAELKMPETITKIGGYAFYGCRSLREMDIPQSVTDIGGIAFVGCDSMTDIRVSPNNAAYASQDGMLLDKAMTTILQCPGAMSDDRLRIPPGVSAIALGAFAHCGLLTHLEIPFGIVSIGGFAFDGCSGLAQISFPDSVETIGQCALRYCHKLTDIRLPAGLKEIDDGLFDSCNGLARVELPQGLTDIGQSAFQDCTGLQELVIPGSVARIGYAAFRNCAGLTNLSIPISVTTIGEKAFEGCGNLVLQVIERSYAQQYADENVMPYDLLIPGLQTAVPTEAPPTPVPATEAPQLPEETPDVSVASGPAGVSPGSQPTPMLLTDLTQQPEETSSYQVTADENPYAGAFFNVSYYALMNPDLVAASGGDEELLRTHWLDYGIHEGRKGSPAFDAKWYLANNPDMAAAFGADYAQAALHYRAIGVAQGQAGSAEFRAADYAALNPELAAQYGSDLRALAQHYNDQGWAQGLPAVIPGSQAEPAATVTPQAEPEAALLPAETPAIDSAVTTDNAQTKPWPLDSMALHELRVSGRHEKEVAYCGPGKDYREAGTYKTAKMSQIKGVFIEGDWMLVDVNYPGVGRRQIYFRTNAFKSPGNVPQWAFTGFAASLTAETAPRMGPGTEYDTFDDETLSGGTALSVFCEYGGWLFAEFMTAEGLVRGWIDAASAQAE